MSDVDESIEQEGIPSPYDAKVHRSENRRIICRQEADPRPQNYLTRKIGILIKIRISLNGKSQATVIHDSC